MIRQFENLQFDNKSNLGIIQITGRRCTHSGPPVKLRFTALYTFPPLYTQKPAARRVFVFFFSEEKKQKTFHWVPCTLAALTRGLVGCRPLNLSLRLGLRPGTMQSLGLPDLNKILVPISGSGDFVLLLAGTLLCAGPFLKTAAPHSGCGARNFAALFWGTFLPSPGCRCPNILRGTRPAPQKQGTATRGFRSKTKQ